MRSKHSTGRGNRRFDFITVSITAVFIILGLNATAQAENLLRVGVLGEPRSLNPFQATDAWTRRITGLLYQPLYLIDPKTQELIPWLAADQPVYDLQKRTVSFHLRQAQWDDGSEFTAEDVVFTARLFKRFQIPRYYEYWSFITKIEAPDERTVRLTFDKPEAIFHSRTLTSWVVSKKQWEPVAQEAERALSGISPADTGESGMELYESDATALERAREIVQTHQVSKPVGIGPFIFKEWKKRSHIILDKNPDFFAQGETIAGKTVGPYIDTLMLKRYDSLEAATLALKENKIDFLWKGISHAFVKEFRNDPDIELVDSLDNGYRYLAFNLRKPPMSDRAFREAVAYLIDKDFIVERVIHSFGVRLDTVVPPNNEFYFNPNTPKYGQGISRDERIKTAYKILSDAGYRWNKPPVNDRGKIQKGEGLIFPDGGSIPPLTILTPTAGYDIEMATPGQVIQQWLQEFGIPARWEQEPFAKLLAEVREGRKFDMYILGWRSLPTDPDYLRRFFSSSLHGSNPWNYTGYSNNAFDELAEFQASAMFLKTRRRAVLEMQEILMKDLPYIPLFVPKRLEGIRKNRVEIEKELFRGAGGVWLFSVLKLRGKKLR